MLVRAIQRINTGPQSLSYEDILQFNTPITSFYLPTVKPITYANGIFYIPNASQNDYYISWTISIHTALFEYLTSISFQGLIKYDNGTTTEACFSTNYTTTGLIKGFMIIHVLKKSSNDLLQFHIANNIYYSTVYLPAHSYTPIADEIANANICIIAV